MLMMDIIRYPKTFTKRQSVLWLQRCQFFDSVGGSVKEFLEVADTITQKDHMGIIEQLDNTATEL